MRKLRDAPHPENQSQALVMTWRRGGCCRATGVWLSCQAQPPRSHRERNGGTAGGDGWVWRRVPSCVSSSVCSALRLVSSGVATVLAAISFRMPGSYQPVLSEATAAGIARGVVMLG